MKEDTNRSDGIIYLSDDVIFFNTFKGIGNSLITFYNGVPGGNRYSILTINTNIDHVKFKWFILKNEPDYINENYRSGQNHLCIPSDGSIYYNLNAMAMIHTHFIQLK